MFAQNQYETKNVKGTFIRIRPRISINELPKPSYTWKKDGVQLVEDGRISISTDHALYIADLRATDAGLYICEVENPVMKNAGKAGAKQIAEKVQLSISGLFQVY